MDRTRVLAYAEVNTVASYNGFLYFESNGSRIRKLSLQKTGFQNRESSFRCLGFQTAGFLSVMFWHLHCPTSVAKIYSL